MKYKLINSVSKIETICDKVTMDGFDYYVSDELQEKGDPIIHKTLKDKVMYAPDEIGSTQEHWWKVIATNNPNIDIPKVVDEVERLAMSYLDQNYSLSYERTTWQKLHEKTYRVGYNKSQETYPFSEQDMIEFGEWIALNCYRFTPNYKGEDKTTWWDDGDLDNPKKETPISTKELLEIWKEQRTKTIYFS